MRGDIEIIRALNAVLTNELTAVNQYFLHARMYESWGFQHLGQVVYDESIGEMRHADKLIKRILFLNGLPNLQDLNKLKIGESVAEGMAADLQVELGGREAQAAAVRLCWPSWPTPKSTSTFWRRSSASSRRWASRTTCRPPWARSRRTTAPRAAACTARAAARNRNEARRRGFSPRSDGRV
jgi:bacterioferritin